MNEIQFLLYNTPDENIKVNVIVKDETLWLTQKAMAELFDVNSQAITKHLKNIFDEGELSKDATCSKMEQVQKEGERLVKRNVEFYNLDAIISVGYRVNSQKATKFRIWATAILKEYIQKGFVLDDERLKQGNTVFGKDYFRELLERIPSVLFVPAKEGFGSRLRIFLPSAVLITTPSLRLHASFTLWCRINFITLLPGRRRQKLYITAPTTPKKIWG